MPTKQELLAEEIEHIDITRHDVVGLVEAMRHMAFSARDLARAADIYDRMLRDSECGVILCLAGSLVSAGLKKVFVDLVRNRMVDCVVSTGANIVDQDFFEGLGFKHYVAAERLKAGLDDGELRELHIDRIYDTLIDEDELRVCDDTTRQIADSLPPGAYSSREFIREMGAYLKEHGKTTDSLVLAAYEEDVPIFCPAFSDCSAGFGLVAHQHARGDGAEGEHRQREGFLRADATEDPQSDDRPVHARRRRAQEFRAGHRRGGRHPGDRSADAQIRRAGDRGRRARRGPVELDAERGLELGQGRHGLRADGLQRGHAGRAADWPATPIIAGPGRSRTGRRLARVLPAQDGPQSASPEQGFGRLRPTGLAAAATA